MKVFDPIRKQYVELTPEEQVRQYCINVLTKQFGYPKSAIAVEGQINLNSMTRRFDILVYDKALKPFLLVECKRKEVKLTQQTVDQVVSYNFAIQAPYIMITNSLTTYLIEYKDGEYDFLDTLPAYR